MTASVLSCHEISKAFGEVHALSDFSFDFPQRGVIGIIGPNGAGKSTLLNVVTGFFKPDSGSCRYRNVDITAAPPHSITSIGIVRTFQELRLVTRISAADNVLLAMPGQKRETLVGALFAVTPSEEGSGRQEAWRILESVGIGGKRDFNAGHLSYGEQKLLTIACAIATGGQILLLDEPIAGVDMHMRGWILKLLRSLAEEGRLVIMVEHDISAIRSTAENVLVLDRGKLVASGSTDRVLDSSDVLEAYLG